MNNTNLIIVNAGLYWLFAECDNETADAALKTEYKSYRDLCRNNLETLLSGLPFHLPSTQDVTLALSLAVCSESPITSSTIPMANGALRQPTH